MHAITHIYIHHHIALNASTYTHSHIHSYILTLLHTHTQMRTLTLPSHDSIMLLIKYIVINNNIVLQLLF